MSDPIRTQEEDPVENHQRLEGPLWIRLRVPGVLLFSLLLSFLVALGLVVWWPGLSRTLAALDLPHSRLADWLYGILDPLFLFAVSGLSVFWKYACVFLPGRPSSEQTNVQLGGHLLFGKRLVFAGGVLLLCGVVLFSVEHLLLKPMFNHSRPLARVEHLVLSQLAEDGRLVDDARFPLHQEDFHCPAAPLVFELAKGSAEAPLSQTTVLAELSRRAPSNHEEMSVHVAAIFEGSRKYSHELSDGQQVSFLIRARDQSTADKRLWLTDFFQSTGELYSLSSSTPSGFAMRQIAVLLFAIVLLIQSGDIGRRIFRSQGRRYGFIALQVLALVLVCTSRVYGRWHTPYDIYMSVVSAGIVAVVLITLVHFQRAKLVETQVDEYERYLDASRDGFYRTNDKGRIVYCNSRFCEIFGFADKEEASSATIESLYVEPQLRTELVQQLRSSKTRSVEDYRVYVHPYNEYDPKKRFVISVDSTLYSDVSRGIKNGIEGTVRLVTATLEGMQTAFYQTDTEGRITFCNSAFAKLLGYENVHELMLQDITQFWQKPEDRKLFLSSLESGRGERSHVVLARRRTVGTTPGETPSFENVLLEVNSRVSTASFPQRRVSGTIRDVTFLEQFADYTFGGVYVIQEDESSGDCVFSFVNAGVKDIFGYEELTASEFVEEISVAQVIAPEDRERILSQVRLKISGVHDGVVERNGFRGLSAAGRKISVEVSSRHYPSFAGRPAVIGNLRDVTEERRKRERARLQDVSETTLTICHELFSPLGGVGAYLLGLSERFGVGKEPPEPSQVREVLAECQDAISYCAEVTRTLRNIHSRTIGPFEPVSIGPILLHIQESYISDRVSVECALDGDFTVMASHATLNMIFMNLVRNAVESIPESGRVAINVSGDERNCEVIVADTGPGIPPEIRNRLFDPFHSTKGEGRGLGLYIAHLLTTALGGTIQFAEPLDAGTQIDVVLPIAREVEYVPRPHS